MKFLIVLCLTCFKIAFGQSPSLNYAAINFDLPDTINVAQYYTELKVDKTSQGQYGIAFDKGYLILSNDKNVHSVVFALFPEATRNAKQLTRGLYTYTTKPGFVHFNYNWLPGETQRLLVTTLADSAGNTTYYAGYVFLNSTQQWKYLATWAVANNGKWLKQLSILMGRNNRPKRLKEQKLSVQKAWVQRANGSWKPLTTAKFFTNTKAGMGTDSGRLFIAGDNFINTNTVNGQTLQSVTPATIPTISVTNHVDSLQQASIDKMQILDTWHKAGLDTSLQTNGVYYSMVKQGIGDYINVTDTVTVFYKGSLLQDGSVFDSTKEKPATFPLSRLIKGWQYALVKCRVGGKIRIYIPSGSAYSTRLRSKNIPPNSVLNFDIEVLAAKKK